MRIRAILTAASVLVAGAVANAQAIVDATGTTPGSHTTIAAALATAESEIVVKNTGLYSEPLLITRSVVLRGEDPNNRPIIAMKPTATQPVLGAGDGVYIGGDGTADLDLTIEFKNFILIPSLTGSITDDAMSVSANPSAVLNLTLENILITPNDGSNQPLATSVWDNPNMASPAVRVPDDGIYLMDNTFSGYDGDVHATFTDLVIIGVGVSNTTGDALVAYVGEGGSTNFSGVGTSYSRRYGSQISGRVPHTATGTFENPAWVSRKNGNTGIIYYQSSDLNVDNIVSVDNGVWGLRVDADSVTEFDMTDSLLANNGAEGFWSGYVPDGARNWTITDSTIFANGRNGTDLANVKFEAAITNQATLTITDSIIAGSGSTGFENIGTGIINVDHSGVVTVGSNALASALRNTSTGPVNMTSVVNSDPAFVNTITDPVGETSFDITNGNAYYTASSTDGELNGYGDGPGEPAASAENWSLFE